MSNEFGQYFDRLLTALRATELEQKRQYYSAIDIEDMVKATAVTLDARTKIQKLRKWIEDLQRIREEFATTFPLEHPPAQESPTKDIGSTQQSAETVALINEGNSSSAQNIDEYGEPSVDDTGAFQQKLRSKETFEDFAEVKIECSTSEEIVVASDSYGFIIDNPQKFVLFGKTYAINGCQELLIKLCEVMVLYKPYMVAGLNINPLLAATEERILSLDEQQITAPRIKLSNGFYVTTAGSPAEIKTRCEHILSACGYSSNVLQIL